MGAASSRDGQPSRERLSRGRAGYDAGAGWGARLRRLWSAAAGAVDEDEGEDESESESAAVPGAERPYGTESCKYCLYMLKCFGRVGVGLLLQKDGTGDDGRAVEGTRGVPSVLGTGPALCRYLSPGRSKSKEGGADYRSKGFWWLALRCVRSTGTENKDKTSTRQEPRELSKNAQA